MYIVWKTTQMNNNLKELLQRIFIKMQQMLYKMREIICNIYENVQENTRQSYCATPQTPKVC